MAEFRQPNGLAMSNTFILAATQRQTRQVGTWQGLPANVALLIAVLSVLMAPAGSIAEEPRSTPAPAISMPNTSIGFGMWLEVPLPPSPTPKILMASQINSMVLARLAIRQLRRTAECQWHLSQSHPSLMRVHIQHSSVSGSTTLSEADRDKLLPCIESIAESLDAIQASDADVSQARNFMLSSKAATEGLALYFSRLQYALSRILPETSPYYAANQTWDGELIDLTPESFRLWLADVRQKGMHLMISDPGLASRAASRLSMRVTHKRATRERITPEEDSIRVYRGPGETGALIVAEILSYRETLPATIDDLRKTGVVSRHCLRGLNMASPYHRVPGGPRTTECFVRSMWITIYIDGGRDDDVTQKANEIAAMISKDASPLLGSPYIVLFGEDQ